MTNKRISVHLRKDEKKMIETLLGDTSCKAMAIAEIAKCSAPNIITKLIQTGKDSSTKQVHEFEWKSIESIKPGLICFVQENNNDYFIRAFNLEKEILVFEQPISLKLEYRRRRRHLITFDVDDEVLCLNFVDDDEADNFATALSKVIKNSKPVCNLSMHQDNGNNNLSNDSVKSNDKDLDKKKKKKSQKKKKKSIWGNMFGKKSSDKKVFSIENLKSQIGEEEFNKVKIFLQVARLDVSLLDDPEKGPVFYQFYKDNVAGKHVIEEERKEDYGQVEVEDEDLYDEVVLTDDEHQKGGEEEGVEDFFGEEYADVEEILEIEKPDVTISKVKNMKWPPEPVKNDLDTSEVKSTTTGPPPPPPPPPPPAPTSLIPTQIPKNRKTAVQNTSQGPGNTREDLMTAIKAGGMGGLKKTPPPKVIKDVKTLDDQSMSNLLSGALQMIKNANSLYGDEPNLDSSEGSDSDWSD